MFGLAAGIAIVLVAAVLGAIVAFGLGRTLGRDAVQRFTGTRVARVDALLRRRGILAVIGVRLVPLVLQGQMYGRASLTCDDASPVFPATRHFSSI